VAGLCCLLFLAVGDGRGAAQGTGAAAKKASGKSGASGAKAATPPWLIEGTGSKDSEEEALKVAKEDALDKACKKVREYLLNQKPPILWTPAAFDIVKQQMFADSPRRLPEMEVDLGPAGKAKLFRWEWTLSLSTEQLDTLRQEDKRYRAAIISEARHKVAFARMEALGKLTAWSVLALAGVFGYLRIDQWTAGTRRGWLRVALASLLAGSGIGWWLLS
jgi:hypothetical protein